MDLFLDIIQTDNFRIELQFHDGNKCSAIFTTRDEDNRRIIKAPIMENGQVKFYTSAEEAIADAMKKLNSLNNRKPSMASSAISALGYTGSF